MRPDQTVYEMVEEVLKAQAEALVALTGRTFEEALEAVINTDAGQRLWELANGEHRNQLAAQWQADLLWQRIEERSRSWLEGYVEWLEGKETRTQYHALLEEELASLRG